MSVCLYCQDAPCYTGPTLLGEIKTFNACVACRICHLEDHKAELENEIQHYNPHVGCNNGPLEQLRADLRDVSECLEQLLTVWAERHRCATG